MPRTRHQRRTIELSNQNASQPVYRLSPELISEIFLRAQPDVFREDLGVLIRYLVGISSITGHFRRIALDCGKLWALVGFQFLHGVKGRCKRALVVMEAFLERSQGCSLHFFFYHAGPSRPAPDWFYSSLLALLSPHTGRVKTFTFQFYSAGGFKTWEQLHILLSDMVNVNKLTLRAGFRDPAIPLPGLNALHSLKELTFSGFTYDESVRDIINRVEMLSISPSNPHLPEWFGPSVKLKRLFLGLQLDTEWGSTNPKSPIRVEDLMYLRISNVFYHHIAPRLILPHLRHLVIGGPDSLSSHFEPQAYHHSLLRTFSVRMGEYRLSVAVFLIIMNPQLEFLHIDANAGGSTLLPLLSELLLPSQGLMLPNGIPPFPGPSLKYMRLAAPSYGDNFGYIVPVSKLLSSVLSKAPHLKLDMMKCWGPATCEELADQFPSQVKFRESDRDIIPLDDLYESAARD